jgi:hypothetical protein
MGKRNKQELRVEKREGKVRVFTILRQKILFFPILGGGGAPLCLVPFNTYLTSPSSHP